MSQRNEPDELLLVLFVESSSSRRTTVHINTAAKTRVHIRRQAARTKHLSRLLNETLIHTNGLHVPPLRCRGLQLAGHAGGWAQSAGRRRIRLGRKQILAANCGPGLETAPGSVSEPGNDLRTQSARGGQETRATGLCRYLKHLATPLTMTSEQVCWL